ncbi:MAG: hypothetical protein IKZ25_04390 [Clostridia bacterium]|nr:hypothetical protein [Clostridia bacterium]
MPYINLATTEKLSDETKKTLKEEFGKAITLIPGKTEQWLMINLEGEKTMSLGGEFKPCAIVDIWIYGSSTAEAYENVTKKVTEILEKYLDLSRENIYVCYQERLLWGHNGSNF